MVEYLRHYTAAFVIFAIITTLWVGIYKDMETAYSIERTDIDGDGYNIMEALENLNLLSAMESLSEAIYRIANPENAADLLGAMALAGYGVIKTISAIILLPIEMIGVLTGFYYIPPIVVSGVIILSFIYVAFILISTWQKERI